MSILWRSILGSLLLFGGLLLVAGAGLYKSSDRIRYERQVERKEPVPEPPARGGPNVLMILGGLVSLGGLAVIGIAARDMVREIGAAGSAAERALQREWMEKKSSKPKP
jgi:drug/metabolite transporter (DMT)-like permease